MKLNQRHEIKRSTGEDGTMKKIAQESSTIFGKFEQGGMGYGEPELHGTEALIGPGFYKDLISPLGGMDTQNSKQQSIN